ncbi:MAG: McrC family protein [Colwellia sp.]|jgi:McrBC 5-methylcytosine restriction system component
MIQVREYAVLTCDSSQTSSMALGVVSEATFDWLLKLQKTWRKDTALLRLKSRNSIELGSYVGFLQSPNGECIEVLPKLQRQRAQEDELAILRKLLRDMLQVSLQLKPRESGAANLQRTDTPLHEWIFTQFLAELATLVKRGLRFDYQRVEEESRFIRGQLDQNKQSRQMPDRATWFHIRHDIYSPDRVENRLLRSALNYVLKLSKTASNWRLANELSHQLITIEAYRDPLAELPRWQRSKLMQPYNAVRPWCELILEQLNPNFQKGEHRGIALMFPMERLFENYVEHYLRLSLRPDGRLKRQASTEYLINKHQALRGKETAWFQLKPDLILRTLSATNISVLDVKWKRLKSALTSSAQDQKYGLSQGDLYQLFTYGQKYMNGKGHMMLIFPRCCSFYNALPRLSFDDDLHLWLVPFDLDAKKLVGGDWVKKFPGIINVTQV